jgi:hypothetical protein
LRCPKIECDVPDARRAQIAHHDADTLEVSAGVEESKEPAPAVLNLGRGLFLELVSSLAWARWLTGDGDEVLGIGLEQGLQFWQLSGAEFAGYMSGSFDDSLHAEDCLLCALTFELTPTAEAGRLARAVQH